jgi:putative FmdB family regulatory protein
VPTYDYQCRSCGTITEVVHSMFEDGPTTCERCGGELRRVFHPTGIIFKGGGFYKTDSRSAPSSAVAGSSGGGSSGTSDAGAPATSSGDAGSSDKGAPSKPSGEGAGKSDRGSG